MQERLQKILSTRGICSRRKAEEYILAGLVKVNGAVAKLGQKADPDIDEVKVDGKILEAKQKLLYYVMNKPVGVETKDAVPAALHGAVFHVGRLDKDTGGLLLLTNDGTLAYRLTHPKFDHEKEYEVTTVRPITDGQLHKLERGVTIDGAKTKQAKSGMSGEVFKTGSDYDSNRSKAKTRSGSGVDEMRVSGIIECCRNNKCHGELDEP